MLSVLFVGSISLRVNLPRLEKQETALYYMNITLIPRNKGGKQYNQFCSRWTRLIRTGGGNLEPYREGSCDLDSVVLK